MAPSKDRWVRRFVISETSRHKKGFTIYKVTSVMFLKSTPNVASKVSIWKRYSDFKKLYNILYSANSSLQIKEPFPPFPKPKFFGRFEAEVIEERRECALKFLEFIGRHRELFTNDAFVKFFESDNLDTKFLDSTQSLSSDTSEDDRNNACENRETSISDVTNLPKFVCTKKVTPTIIGNQNDIKSNSKPSSSNITVGKSTHRHDQVNSDNENTKDNIDVLETLIYEKDDLQSKYAISKSAIIHDGSDLTQSMGESMQYILIAAAHMSAAFRHEAIAEYEEAFTQYKLGISHLINGVQNEKNQEKKTIVQEKITKYLQRAERLYNRHLNCNVSVLYKPVSELQNYKVIELMKTVMVVKDTLQGFKRVIKTIEKIAGCKKDISCYILRGKVPYMVQLYSCMQTDSTVFLILQYMSKGKLWDFAKCNYKLYNKKPVFERKGHSRSVSCDAVIQIDSMTKRDNISTQENISKIDYTYEKASSAKEDHCISTVKNSIPEETTELVKNAKILLQSVNATLKRSNSIASRLNESEPLLYKTMQDRTHNWNNVLNNDILHTEDNDNSKISGNFSELSINDHCAEINNDKNMIVSAKKDEELSNYSEAVDCDSIGNKNNLSLVNSSFNDLSNNKVESEKQMWYIPESVVRIWAAEILLALEALHQQDVIVSDLRPDNILINDCGNICLTYIVPRKDNELLRLKKPYSSPELCMFTPPISITTSADVWSFGVLLYELLTGFDFQTKHPGSFHTHSLINIPNNLSENAKCLLLSILKYQPSDRLTIPEIKQHSFFTKIDWLDLLNTQV